MMKLVHPCIPLSCLLFAFTVACGGGDGEGDGVDARPGADAPPGLGPCMVDENLGTIEAAQNPAAFSRGGAPDAPLEVEVRAPFNQLGFETDWFTIRLYVGGGYFPTALQPGTYDLTGPETDYFGCSACVMLVGDHSGDPAEEEFNTFMATSGTLTLNSVAPNFSATLSNATFQHVAFAPNQGPNPSNCVANVASLEVNASLVHLQGVTDAESAAGASADLAADEADAWRPRAIQTRPFANGSYTP